ncbi:hypothetical protein B0H14DRAFT_2813834 [Mycena olivaceomarginata]|nr:hypothetical protein B0H14DRAFT_2813834 [Mycena olivaceomarginata]
MQKPSLFSVTGSKSSSDLTAETGQRTPYLSVRAEGPRQSFLSAVFTHRRSRSGGHKRCSASIPSLKYTSSSCCVHDNSAWQFESLGFKGLKKPMRKKYDTVILVDDSGSMTSARLQERKDALERGWRGLETLAEAAQQYDGDGIDIYFLNNKTESLNIKSSSEVRALFAQILKPRLRVLEEARIEPDGTPSDKESGEEIKRCNFIVITDGEATDNPKYAILDAASRLKAIAKSLYDTVCSIGNDSRATKALKELDDDLHKTRNIRDIVDTTPYSKLNPVTADGLIKVLLGGINRRIDEQTK